MEHFWFPGNIAFAGRRWPVFMKGWCVYSLSVKQCLRSVNHEQFLMQMTQNSKHNKWLQILAEDDFPPKLLWSENADSKFIASGEEDETTRNRRGAEKASLTTVKATSSTQPPQTCTEAATKYCNYCKRNRWREETPTAHALCCEWALSLCP